MGGGPVLEDLYVPYHSPFYRFRAVPRYEPTWYTDYYNLHAQSALMELIASMQHCASCTTDRSGQEAANEARAERNCNAAREEASKAIAAQEPVTSNAPVESLKTESSDAIERKVSSSIEESNSSLEVQISSASLRSDSEDQNIDAGLKNDDGVSLIERTASGQSEEVEVDAGSIEERRAAVVVQARYRGHLVRMSRPLEQLRSIAAIGARLKLMKEQAGDAAFLEELRKKESKGIGFEEETMALLLQLDNIQGSHPLVRQIRKSVAREIVALQESVDALLPQRIRTSRR